MWFSNNYIIKFVFPTSSLAMCSCLCLHTSFCIRFLLPILVILLQMEKLARSQYLRKKDPKDSALLYIVLNRLPVLSGLFKISKDEKDKPLVAFLSRNFQVCAKSWIPQFVT